MVQELIEGLLCEAMVYVIQGEIIGYPYLGLAVFFSNSPLDSWVFVLVNVYVNLYGT